MAFKMNPKSPLLMKAMGHASPAKNMNKGYGPAETSSPAKQRLENIADLAYPILGGLAGKAAKALQEGREEPAQNILPSVQEVKPVKKKKELSRTLKKELVKNTKKELNRTKKKNPSIIESDPIKKSDPLDGLAKTTKPKTTAAEKPKTTAAEKLRDARKKMQSAKDNKKANRLLNRAEGVNIKADRNERRMKRKQAKRKRIAERNSPAKQRSSKNMTPAEEKALNDKSIFGPGKTVAKPPEGGSKSKYDILFEKVVKKATTTPKKGNKNVKGEKHGKSPAKQSKG